MFDAMTVAESLKYVTENLNSAWGVVFFRKHFARIHNDAFRIFKSLIVSEVSNSAANFTI